MSKWIPFFILGLFSSTFSADKSAQFETDLFKTKAGELKVTFIGHASLIFGISNKIIYIDPYSKLADYTKLPQADLVMITHEHQDHLDLSALSAVTNSSTKIILTASCTNKTINGIVLKNGDKTNFSGFQIEAVPAYNITNKRDNGQPFHSKGSGNGYVITFGDKKFYIAGDTENIPEMKNLSNIYCAFPPMNLPYTMTPEMAADAALMIKPKIFYPYHFGETDTGKLLLLMKKNPDIETRIRKMK